MIIGGGGHAKVVADVVATIKQFEVVGYLANSKNDNFDLEYLGDDTFANNLYQQGINSAVLALGNVKVSDLRKKIAEMYQNIGFEFPNIISPKAIISPSVNWGIGNFVSNNVVINSTTLIGNFNILNTSSVIEHDCKIANFVHIAPAVALSGGVSVGNSSMIGVGAKVVQGVEIGDNVMVGAGATVTKKLVQSGTYVGSPAKLLEKK